MKSSTLPLDRKEPLTMNSITQNRVVSTSHKKTSGDETSPPKKNLDPSIFSHFSIMR